MTATRNAGTPAGSGPAPPRPAIDAVLLSTSFLGALASLVFVACGGESSVTGLADAGTGSSPTQERAPASLSVATPRDTVRLLRDTVPLSVTVRDRNGREIEGDVELRFAARTSSPQDELEVSAAGEVWLEPDSVYLDPWDREHNRERGCRTGAWAYVEVVASGGPCRFHGDRDAVPASAGPRTATVEVRLPDAGLSAEVGLVTSSPTWRVELRPGGACLAVGHFPSGERIHVDASVDARDLAGRAAPMGRVRWEMADPGIAGFAVTDADSTEAEVFGRADGRTQLRATVADTTTAMDVFSSERTDANGNVDCSHLM